MATVQAVRHLLAQRWLATLICAAALLLKLLVPTGYMVDSHRGYATFTVCTGMAPATAMESPTVRSGMPGHGKSGDHGKAEQSCAFAGLSAAMMGALDPVQLVGLIAFIMAAGLIGPPLPVASARVWLRPPLRGPPVTS